MNYLKKTIRGKNRSEDVYFVRSNNSDDKIWRLRISSETKLTETEFMAYLKIYLDEWIKANRLLDIDDLNIQTRKIN